MLKRPKITTGTGYCKECGETVSAHIEDDGIGPYEYWGYLGTHHDYNAHCDECGGYVDDYDEDPQWDDFEPPDFDEHYKQPPY